MVDNTVHCANAEFPTLVTGPSILTVVNNLH